MIELTRGQYDALVTTLRECSTGKQRFDIENLIREIELANGITTYILWVTWVDPSTRDVPLGRIVEWPSSMSIFLQKSDEPITKQDVLDAIASKTTSPQPHTILVTDAVDGSTGWTTLDKYFEPAP
jgi:hypothetical protein